MANLVLRLYQFISVPISVWFILDSADIRHEYRMNWVRRLALGLRMAANTLLVPTATSYKAHLVMALKLLEMPSGLAGDVVECGAWKGGSAANLSLVCRIVGRRLLVYDSFEGLPAA